MKSESGNPIRDGFVRQRRNLMIVSLVLLFAESTELQISKLNVFGNELLIEHPATITIALWIGFFYWLWRYYAYFNDIGEKGFWIAQRNRMTDLVGDIALRQIKRDAEMMSRIAPEKNAQLRIVGQPNWYERSLRRFVLKLDIQIFIPSSGQNKSLQLEKYVVEDRRALLLAHVRAWLHELIKAHRFSEYILPFLVACLPVIYRVSVLVGVKQ